MFKSRSDLPLENDATSRFLPVIVAVMVFMATVAMAGAIVLQTVLDRWHRDVSGTLTVQVAPATGDPARSAVETRARLEAVVRILQDTPGIAAAHPLDQADINALLEPWLGSADLIADLPVPQLVDVTLEPRATVDMDALVSRLSAVAPGTSVDDHRAWLSKLIRFGRGLEILALAVVIIVSTATATTVVYATRTGLSVHRSVIEVLHLIGAQDDYIARQFAHASLMQGLRGGMTGFVLATPMLAGIGWLAGRLEGSLLPELVLRPVQWLMLLSLPIAAAYLAKVTARITVHRTLARMP